MAYRFGSEDFTLSTPTLNQWAGNTSRYSGHRLRLEWAGGNTRPDDSAVPFGMYSNIKSWLPGGRAYRQQNLTVGPDSRGLNPHFYIKSLDRQRDLRHASIHPEWGEPNIDRINRHRLMIWIPEYAEARDNAGMGTTMHWATHCRYHDAPDNDGESDNGHWYHYFSPTKRNGWNVILVDPTPTHQRGGNSSVDIHDVYYPWPEHSPGYNYFDLMCRYYIRHWLRKDIDPEEFPPGQDYFLDQFEWWEDENNEAISHIFSLGAAYHDDEDSVHVYWSGRRPSTAAMDFEVRYAFSDVHALGWNNLIVPTNTAVSRPEGGNGPNSGGGFIYWNSVPGEIPTTQDILYVAVRAVNPSPGGVDFRQIHVPLVDGVQLPI